MLDSMTWSDHLLSDLSGNFSTVTSSSSSNQWLHQTLVLVHHRPDSLQYRPASPMASPGRKRPVDKTPEDTWGCGDCKTHLASSRLFNTSDFAMNQPDELTASHVRCFARNRHPLPRLQQVGHILWAGIVPASSGDLGETAEVSKRVAQSASLRAAGRLLRQRKTHVPFFRCRTVRCRPETASKN